MYKHILVAIDGSETSDRAIREAIELGKDGGSTLRLIHVVDATLAYSAVAAPDIAEYQRSMEEAGRKVIANGSAVVRQAGIEFDTKLVAIDGLGQHVYNAIDDEAKRWPADLIVIGTHGRRGIRRLFLGSIAEGLARIASKPVLLIRGS